MNRDQDRRKPVGLTKDAGWQIGVRRTFPISAQRAWRLLTSTEGVRLWLGGETELDLVKGATYRLPDGTSGEVRVFSPLSHIRISWHPKGWPRASLLQVRILPKDSRTVIAFHQEHLPGPKEREERRAFFKQVLERLEETIQE